MKIKIVFAVIFMVISVIGYAKETLRVFTWDGYVVQEDIKAVNKILADKGYDIEVKVIEPFAAGPEQMFDVIRSGKCDISFLTLNYIKMQGEKTSKLLQVIDTKSPRLPNYEKLRKELKNIPMGMSNEGALYVPFGGGAYGIWANMKNIKREEVPKSVKELWNEKWKGKIALSKGQIEPNIALVMLAMDKSPYYINDLVMGGKRDVAMKFSGDEAQKKLNELYGQVKNFWDGVPDYNDEILLTASYGLEIAGENAKGGKWEYVQFKEGSTVWMDTINFMKELSGKKLEAAEIFANYFIGKEVQTRVVKGLSMVSVSTVVDSNPLIDNDPNFYSQKMFWPPYDKMADNIIKNMSDKAMKEAGK